MMDDKAFNRYQQQVRRRLNIAQNPTLKNLNAAVREFKRGGVMVRVESQEMRRLVTTVLGLMTGADVAQITYGEQVYFYPMGNEPVANARWETVDV